MISKSYCFSSSITLSGAVVPLVKAKRAEVPSVTFSRTRFMKSSSIPTSVIEPLSAPIPAPIAAPRKGTKKISPNRKPQNAPLLSWGFLSRAREFSCDRHGAYLTPQGEEGLVLLAAG